MNIHHEANVPQSGLEDRGRMDAVKEKLGQVGRKLKRIEVRESIVDHPFAAVGISAAVGAVIALARPVPERSRTGNLFMAALSAIGLRIVREAAMRQFGSMAKEWLQNRQGEQPQTQTRTY